MVAVDDPVQGLKPGMSAEVTILVENVLEHVLTVPVQAVVGTPAMGKHRKCFIMTAEGPAEREIEIGLSNDTMAEIRSGLKEGDQVVLNPRGLLSEQDKVKLASAEHSERSDQGKAAPGKVDAPPSGGGDKNGTAK
jgi:hypothetical protein